MSFYAKGTKGSSREGFVVATTELTVGAVVFAGRASVEEAGTREAVTATDTGALETEGELGAEDVSLGA